MANSNAILDQFKTNQSKEVIDTSKKLKVGIIGTGWIADAHIQQYLDMPDVEIVAGADLVHDGDEGLSLGLGYAPVKLIREWAIKNNVLMVVESEGLDPTGPDEVLRCMEYLRTLDLSQKN